MGSRLAQIIHPALLFVVVAWGLNFTIVKVAYWDVNPPAVAILRWAGTVAMMALIMRWAGQDWRMDREDWVRLSVAGFIANGVYMILFLEGMNQVTPAQGAITLATAPIFTALFAIFAKQDRFRPAWLIGSIIAFAGVALATLGGASDAGGSVKGVVIVLISAVVWAFSVILMKPILSRHHPIKVMATSLLGAGLALIPYGIPGLARLDWGHIRWQSWWSLVYLVVFAGAGAFVAYYKALQDIGPSRTAMVQYLVPPVAAVFAWLIVGAPLHIEQLIGLLLALGGLWIGSRRPDAQPPLEPAVE